MKEKTMEKIFVYGGTIAICLWLLIFAFRGIIW